MLSSNYSTTALVFFGRHRGAVLRTEAYSGAHLPRYWGAAIDGGIRQDCPEATGVRGAGNTEHQKK